MLEQAGGKPLLLMELEPPTDLARQIQAANRTISGLGDRVSILEERLVATTRKQDLLSGLVADQGEIVLTVKTVASGTKGEVDRLNYGVSKVEGQQGVIEAKQDQIDLTMQQLKARVEELEGKRLNGIHGVAIVGGLLGIVLIIGALNLSSKQQELAAHAEKLEQAQQAQANAIQLTQSELGKAREQQRVDAQYLVNEVEKAKRRK